MRISVALFSALLGLSVVAAPRIAPAEDAPIPGHVVIAIASGNALVIWDASPAVAAIVNDKASDADANARLERDALRVMAQSLPKLDKGSKAVKVRVIYNKTGAVSPVYGAATFAGVEVYATLDAPFRDATTDRGKWKENGAKAGPPSWMQWKVLGQLPAR